MALRARRRDDSESAPRGGDETKKPFWTSWWPFAVAWPITLVLGPTAIMLRDTDRMAPVLVAFPVAVVIAVAQRHADARLPVGWVMLFQWPAYALILLVAARRSRLKAAAIAVALLHVAAIVFGSPWSWGPSLADFSRRLRETAGADARHCGVVDLWQPRASALACARESLASDAPFSVGLQVMGIDSTIYLGLARSAGGRTTELHWDSDGSGGSNLVPLSNLYDRPCAHPSIQEENGHAWIECDPATDDGH
jgi:hypothetical protein